VDLNGTREKISTRRSSESWVNGFLSASILLLEPRDAMAGQSADRDGGERLVDQCYTGWIWFRSNCEQRARVCVRGGDGGDAGVGVELEIGTSRPVQESRIYMWAV
jgi:hypothetical protein